MENCMHEAAKKLYTNEDKQQHMVNDLKMLLRGFKLCVPLLLMIFLGFSLTLISVILEVILAYSFYLQIIDYYCQLRNHNMVREPGTLDGNPVTEISTFFKVSMHEIVSTLRTLVG